MQCNTLIRVMERQALPRASGRRRAKWLARATAIAYVLVVLGGCSSRETELQPSDPAQSPDPVKLVLWSWAGYPTQEEFQELFAAPVHAKYPHITLELTQGASLDQLIAQNQIPDLMISSLLDFNAQGIRQAGLLYDLRPLIQKHKFDLNRIEDGLMKQVQVNSKNNEIYGIPYFVNFTSLWYNKDIFEKFGVGYPQDDMTWDEAVALARKVTRNDGGVQYRGLDPENINRLAWQLGLGYVDPKTEQPLIHTWKPAYEPLQSIISIPGNAPEGKITQWNANPFFKDRNVAMMISSNQIELAKSVPDLNWDIVTPPKYKEYPDAPVVAGGRALLIANTSKYKDDAFLAIEAILSDEAQKQFNRRGQLSPLKDKSVQQEFQQLPVFKGKNVQSIFKQKPGWYAVSNYDNDVSRIPFNHSLDLYKGKDLNTVIRETEEEMAVKIRELQAK